MNSLLTAWDDFSLAQRVGACVTLALLLGAFLYVPYQPSTTDSYEYDWIWRPVRCHDPVTDSIHDQIDTDELRKSGIAIDPNLGETSGWDAHRCWRRARWNAGAILVLGILLHFAIGAVNQLRKSKSR